MSIDFTTEIRKILEDHKHFSLCDERNLDYLVGMIREALDDHQADDRQMELFQGTTSEKISQHKIDGIEYSEFAHLSTDRPDEVRRDGDGKPLDDRDWSQGDDYYGIKQRRVKSYGFFKNEYYDD